LVEIDLGEKIADVIRYHFISIFLMKI